MTQTDNAIREGNKKIAAFMDFDPTKLEIWDTESEEFPFYRKGTWEDVNYHDSWNDLMPVVFKIRAHEKKNKKLSAVSFAFLAFYQGPFSIETVYSAVLQFIEWYNTQNLNNGK